MNSGSGGGGGGATTGDVNPSTPILQPPSNFFNTSSFSQPINNPNNLNFYNNLDYYSLLSKKTSNYNPNPIYDPDSQLGPSLNPNPTDSGPDKLLGVTNKNLKKRTRASRRAPTTVLTTDTTNFRQMVQEFTGIPPAPFSGSSSFSRRSDFYAAGISPASGFHLNPSESHGFTKQPLNLSNFQNLKNLENQMFSVQSVGQTNVNQEVNVRVGESQRLETSSASLKRWRGQDENLVNFEGVNGNIIPNVVVSSSRSDGDQVLPGNEGSWSF